MPTRFTGYDGAVLGPRAEFVITHPGRVESIHSPGIALPVGEPVDPQYSFTFEEGVTTPTWSPYALPHMLSYMFVTVLDRIASYSLGVNYRVLKGTTSLATGTTTSMNANQNQTFYSTILNGGWALGDTVCFKFWVGNASATTELLYASFIAYPTQIVLPAPLVANLEMSCLAGTAAPSHITWGNPFITGTYAPYLPVTDTQYGAWSNTVGDRMYCKMPVLAQHAARGVSRAHFGDVVSVSGSGFNSANYPHYNRQYFPDRISFNPLRLPVDGEKK